MAAAEVLEQAEQVEEHEFGELDFERLRKFVVNRQGQDFLLYAGLVTGLHQVSGGYFSIDTRLEQLPTEGNGQVTVCCARVQIYDSEQPDVVRRSATGIGDASGGNVNRQMQGATIRMAETRAKARALRDLLGVSMITFEEVGPGGAEDNQLSGAERQPPSNDRPFPPKGAGGERIEVRGKLYDRPQVLTIYKERLAQAREAGLVIPPGDILPDDAALPMLVGAAQGFRSRLEARDGVGK